MGVVAGTVLGAYHRGTAPADEGYLQLGGVGSGVLAVVYGVWILLAQPTSVWWAGAGTVIAGVWTVLDTADSYRVWDAPESPVTQGLLLQVAAELSSAERGLTVLQRQGLAERRRNRYVANNVYVGRGFNVGDFLGRVNRPFRVLSA